MRPLGLAGRIEAPQERYQRPQVRVLHSPLFRFDPVHLENLLSHAVRLEHRVRGGHHRPHPGRAAAERGPGQIRSPPVAPTDRVALGTALLEQRGSALRIRKSRRLQLRRGEEETKRGRGRVDGNGPGAASTRSCPQACGRLHDWVRTFAGEVGAWGHGRVGGHTDSWSKPDDHKIIEGETRDTTIPGARGQDPVGAYGVLPTLTQVPPLWHTVSTGR